MYFWQNENLVMQWEGSSQLGTPAPSPCCPALLWLGGI